MIKLDQSVVYQKLAAGFAPKIHKKDFIDPGTRVFVMKVMSLPFLSSLLYWFNSYTDN
jgi:hypothetical protein